MGLGSGSGFGFGFGFGLGVVLALPPLLLVAAHAVHLHEELRLDAPARFVLVGAATLAGERVDLVNEDGGGRVEASHVEEQLYLARARGWGSAWRSAWV